MSKGKALIYCRISSPAQRVGNSLNFQETACLAHAEQSGYTVHQVIKEVYSGAKLFERTKLSEARALIRSGEFRAIIAYKVDRLSRDSTHLAILSEECERFRCALIFVEAGPSELRVDEARAAEIERRNLGERIALARRTMLREGRPVLTGWNLYGYRANYETGFYSIYEPEAEIVRRIFSLCAAGRGSYSIASRLNREGVPSPKIKVRPGAKWTSSAIEKMLKNRSYMGEEYCLKTECIRGRDLPRPESEWIKLPQGVRPAIVSREIWEACQEIIRAHASRMKRRVVEHPSLLRGHVFCAECGSAMIRNHFRRGKYEYLKYRCGTKWRPFKTECRGLAVPFKEVQEWTWNKVKAILSSPDIMEPMISEIGPSEIARQLTLDLEAAKRELGHIAQALEALLSHSAQDPILRPYLEREIGRVSLDKERLERTVAEIEERIKAEDQHLVDLRYLQERCELVGADSLTYEERRLALQAMRVRVDANGEASSDWSFNFGFQQSA